MLATSFAGDSSQFDRGLKFLIAVTSRKVCLLFAAEQVVYGGFFRTLTENSCLLLLEMSSETELKQKSCGCKNNKLKNTKMLC